MAELLQLRGVGAHAGPRVLYRDVDLTLQSGDRLGLVGPNGAGKSTLLRLLAGEDTPWEGERMAKRGLRVAWARQELVLDPQATVAQVVAERLQRTPGPPPGLDADVAARRTLGRCGFADADAPVSSLSGGWKRRLALAAEFATGCDLLLLDEPTNHLDLESITWLEETLVRERAACVVVSHDRRFLETVATRMAEIDRRHPGSFFACDGNYSSFLEQREQAFEQLQKTEASLAAQVREEIRYLRQGPKARRSKSQSRVDRAHDTIAEFDRVRALNRERTMEGAFSETGRRTRRLVVVEKASQSYDDAACFDELDLILGPGRRVGLVGPNGSGKTTLLRTLLGELPPKSGRVDTAPQVRIVYFDQEREQLDEGQTVRNALSPEGDTVEVAGRRIHVASWARQLLFRDDQLDQPVRTLSGGERARVLVARLMRTPADVLLLDEPTNDLDIPTLEQLEQSLLAFEGAVVLVSHDRFLVDRVTTDLLALDGKGGWRELADLDQWESMLSDLEQEAPKNTAKAEPATQAAKSTPKSASTKPKLSYKEKRELESMEESILEAEGRVEELEAESTEPGTLADPQKLHEVYGQLKEAQDHVEALYARWSELEEKAP